MFCPKTHLFKTKSKHLFDRRKQLLVATSVSCPSCYKKEDGANDQISNNKSGKVHALPPLFLREKV